MNDLKKLLAEATPLPWSSVKWSDDSDLTITTPSGHGYVAEMGGGEDASHERPDADLILHAVNHLPDYIAAVDLLADVLPWVAPPDGGLTYGAFDKATELLRRLRDEVPA